MKRTWFIPLIGMFLALQVKAVDGDGTPRDTVKTYNMDEVVVTSSPKETNVLQSLPGAISIISPMNINGRQILSLKDISSYVPNLYMPDYGAKLTSAIYIRGIGARSSGQSIALYVDNMPYFDKSTFDFELSDIQRIEVLRGPQGTLYGRNAMGGIVNIYTLSPLDYQGTRLALSYGNYGRLDAKVSHYAKLTDHFGISAGVYYNRGDGFFTNDYDGKKMDDGESMGGNIKLHWQITPSFKVAYTVSAEYADQGAFPYGLYDAATQKVAVPHVNDESSYKRTMLNNSLLLSYETDRILFTSTTGHQYLDDDMRMDQDFSPMSIFILNQKQKQHAFSEELNLRSNTGNNYQWSFGAFGFYGQMNTEGPVTFKEDGIRTIFQSIFDKLKEDNPRMPVTLTVMDKSLYIPGSFENPSYGMAFYHQSTFNNLFVEGLSLTAGVRLDYEKQELDYRSEAKMNLSMTMPPRMTTPTDISDRYPASTIEESLSQDYWQVLPKISLKYEFYPRTISYLSVSKGYKAGGYNVQMSADIMQGRMQYDVMNAFRSMMPNMELVEPSDIENIMSYKPEKSWNYEAGLKSELLEDRLCAELALFYMDVNDLQITQFVKSGNGRYLSNAGKVESYGAELSVHGRLSNTLSADLNYGYTHATFKEYNTGKEDFGGKYIPYTPRHTLSLGLNYSKLLHGRWLDQIFASAQCSGAGGIYWTEANALQQKFYATLNAQAGVRKDAVAFSLLGKNLTDTDYSAFYFESFGKPYIQRGKPLQFGAKISVSF